MKYLTFTQLRATLGGRARSSIYLDVEAGRLPAPIKLGGRLYWCEADVEDWLRSAPTATVPKTGKDEISDSGLDPRAGRDARHAGVGGEPKPGQRTDRRGNRGRLLLRDDQGPGGARLSPFGGEDTA